MIQGSCVDFVAELVKLLINMTLIPVRTQCSP